jgi:hypothetical protein
MNNYREARGRRDEGRERGAGAGRESSSLVRLFGQMMMLPFTVFVYGMDAFVKTVQGMQRTTGEGMDVVLGGAARAPRESGATTQTLGEAPGGQGETENSLVISSTDCVVEGDAQTNPKETKNMNDTDLSDDKVLKLVRYKVIFIKRDYEVAFPEVEELVSDSMDETGYTAWKIAEFIQRLNETPVPKKWGGGKDAAATPKYPKHGPKYKNGEWIIETLPEDDKKYLRVYFEVLDRYEREHFKYEERQITVLEEIRDQLQQGVNKI